MELKPILIEFILDGKLHGTRRGIGGFPNPESSCAPMVGDVLLLHSGEYVVKARFWDFKSENTSRQGLRLVIEPE